MEKVEFPSSVLKLMDRDVPAASKVCLILLEAGLLPLDQRHWCPGTSESCTFLFGKKKTQSRYEEIQNRTKMDFISELHRVATWWRPDPSSIGSTALLFPLQSLETAEFLSVSQAVNCPLPPDVVTSEQDQAQPTGPVPLVSDGAAET